MLQQLILGTLSSIAEGWLVPGINTPAQDCLHVRSFGHISQNIDAGEIKSIRLLHRNHAENGQPWSFEGQGILVRCRTYHTAHDFSQYRYHEMSRCVRQWRHIKDIKRGAAGHTPVAVDDLGDGALAIECPACPHPGRNLPQGWENESRDKAYALFIIYATTLDDRSL